MSQLIPTLHDRSRCYPGAGAVLALDIANKTGWAMHRAVGRMGSGVADFTPEKDEIGAKRWHRFYSWLDSLRDRAGGIELIYFEEINFIGTSVQNARIKFGFEAMLLFWCCNNNVPCEGIPVGTIKKFITGSGNAPKTKTDMIRRNKKSKRPYTGLTVEDGLASLGLAFKDHNQADAVALLLLGLDKINQRES